MSTCKWVAGLLKPALRRPSRSGPDQLTQPLSWSCLQPPVQLADGPPVLHGWEEERAIASLMIGHFTLYWFLLLVGVTSPSHRIVGARCNSGG